MINRYSDSGKTTPAVTGNMFHYGSVGETLTKGYAVCYPLSFVSSATGELTTDFTARRVNTVNVPDNTNNRAFAGVLNTSQVTTKLRTGLTVHLPGSVCQVYLLEANSVLGAVATFIVGGTNAGKFTTSVAGFGGRGCARLLQTTSGAGLCWAELLDGEESGGVEYITPAAAGGAITPMIGGITVFPTAVTLAANATFTLADGTMQGLKKVFLCKAAMTTSDIVCTVTSGTQTAGATALASISFDADGEHAALEWRCSKWVETFCTATKAAT